MDGIHWMGVTLIERTRVRFAVPPMNQCHLCVGINRWTRSSWTTVTPHARSMWLVILWHPTTPNCVCQDPRNATTRTSIEMSDIVWLAFLLGTFHQEKIDSKAVSLTTRKCISTIVSLPMRSQPCGVMVDPPVLIVVARWKQHRITSI